MHPEDENWMQHEVEERLWAIHEAYSKLNLNERLWKDFIAEIIKTELETATRNSLSQGCMAEQERARDKVGAIKKLVDKVASNLEQGAEKRAPNYVRVIKKLVDKVDGNLEAALDHDGMDPWEELLGMDLSTEL
jgi:hypothetical protein